MTPRDFARRARLKLLARALPRLLSPQPTPDLERIGSPYGGWWVPAKSLGPDSVVYLAGAGEDITFDLGLIDRFGCEVISVDPTPRAVEYVGQHAPASGYRFLPVGLGGTDRSERFYAPSNPAHVSHSITNLQRTDEYFVAELRTVTSLMAELGHDHVDLLKMDIEGAEYEVLDSLLSGSARPTVVCVEFDQPAPVRRTMRYASRMREAGYRVAKVDGFNVTFIRS